MTLEHSVVFQYAYEHRHGHDVPDI
jgi:hypothetical protein